MKSQNSVESQKIDILEISETEMQDIVNMSKYKEFFEHLRANPDPFYNSMLYKLCVEDTARQMRVTSIIQQEIE